MEAKTVITLHQSDVAILKFALLDGITYRTNYIAEHFPNSGKEKTRLRRYKEILETIEGL